MLSSRLSVATAIGLASAALMLPRAAEAQPEIQNDTSAVPQALPVQAAPLSLTTQPMVDPLASTLSEWRSLQQYDDYPFSSYARFMIAHPGWPDEARMRKNAERMVRADAESPTQVVAFFKKFPPQTATGALRYAEALDASGQKDEARVVARDAWTGGSLTPDDEGRLLTRFPGALKAGDNDVRMDKLLWARATSNAARLLSQVSPHKRTLFDARLAFLTRSADAQSKAALVSASDREDPGFVADRAYWLRNTNQVDSARTYLASNLRVKNAPADPAKWLQMVESAAKGAEDSGQFGTALEISRKVELTYSPDTNVSEKGYAERDSYTNITWRGGMLALSRLNRPQDAVRMFDLYGRAARSPQTKAKGLYWAGRSAEAAGKKHVAASYYTEASQFFDQFYGQLALEKLGRKSGVPAENETVAISGADRSAFERSEIVRVASMLGRSGNWQEQTKFLRAIVVNAKTPEYHVLASEYSKRINRPDLSLLIGKSAREQGFPGYFKPSFPTITIPSEERASWTMIHAITRQESQFDPVVVSHAGARGLMQLMPGTARQTAPSAGLGYDFGRLTSDPGYNVRLGSTYFGQLMSQFGGSYVLAVAAYNAGPGNVNKWIRNNGDPREAGADKLVWIEKIPITETRNYVQRVLENAVIYDMLNPNRPAGRTPDHLSVFLGGAPRQISSR